MDYPPFPGRHSYEDVGDFQVGDEPGKGHRSSLHRLWQITLSLILVFGLAVVVSFNQTGGTKALQDYAVPTGSKASFQERLGDATAAADNNSNEQEKGAVQSESGSTVGTTSLDFITYNKYTKDHAISWAANSVSWAKYLAEPYRTTTFQVTCQGDVSKCATDLPSGRDITYTWVFQDGTVLEGTTVEYEFTETGKSLVRVVRERPLEDGSKKVTVYSAEVMVKYVRREIRSLTEEDRTALLDAMSIMYRLTTAEGRVLFGDKYKGIDYFMDMHLLGAGLPDCDHWHDNAGMLTHHVGFTLEAEQALQVIDPSVCMPYWEYTIDTELYGTGSDDFAKSIIFSDDWFGEMSPDNPMHTVTKGRWAYTPIQTGLWSSVHNPYGLQRSPWNLDPTPFMTRHSRVVGLDPFGAPDCSIVHEAFMQTNLADMNVYLNGATHGPVHIQIGGAWGQQSEGMLSSIQWGSFGYIPIISKMLWRYGFLRYPDTCSNTSHDGIDSNTQCKTSCPEEVYLNGGSTSTAGKGGSGNNHHGVKNAYDVLELTDVMSDLGVAFFKDLEWDDDDNRWYFRDYDKYDTATQNSLFKNLLDGLCDIGRVGDMFTSAAPADPIFWILHPTMERLVNWRILVGESGALPFDSTWGYTTGLTTGEMSTVCDWSNVKDNTGLPNCVEQTCSGHNEDDMLPFSLYKIGGTVPVQMTNAELLSWIHPSTEDLPYMYDEYRWDHCEGYDFFNTAGTGTGTAASATPKDR